MERDRLTQYNHVAPSAPAEGEGADASFLDSLIDVLETKTLADEAEAGRAEAKLSRQLRDAIGARLRDAA
ncbi:MAG TPA: hypothetical protein VGN97_09350 [Mesorhizobium sp.]|jgi:hypothetical protein|nr:hypothetical protein [Mesorhizobium sp.]